MITIKKAVLEDRGWKYATNEPVVKWIHNNDKTGNIKGNKIINPTETNDIEKELSKFLEWAKNNPKCFQLKTPNCSLEIEAKDDASLLKIRKEKQTLFQTSFDTNETDLKKELLQSSNEFKYDKAKQAILSEFNPENISFQRKVKIKKTVFKSIPFDPVEIDNVSFIPSDKENADRWYGELLFKNTNKYFLDESSYKEFADEMTNPILQHYKITIPERSKLIEMYSKPELAVELNKEQCEELFQVFVYHFWEHSTDEQTATDGFEKVKPANKFSLPTLKQILLTSPNTKNNSLNETLKKSIKNAQKSISFSTFQRFNRVLQIKVRKTGEHK